MDKKQLADLLSPNSKVSSIRWALIEAVKISKIAIYGLFFILAFQLYKGQSPDLMGAAAYFGGIATILGVIIGAKAYQVKNENNNIE